MERALIFDIQGYSVHDGPGCRTLVFLSGCPLRCSWCANPEGQLLRPRLLYRAQRCARDLRCLEACPHDAITRVQASAEENGKFGPQFDRSICERCASLECVSACLNEALKIAGRSMTVEELMGILARDQDFWGEGGGVTFTGGEPLLQREFILEALQSCQAAYMPTAVETCAHVETTLLLQALQWIDWLFVDLKHVDSALHRQETGEGNELILHNIAQVASSGWDGRLVVRLPVIPGFNDTPDNLHATAAFMHSLGLGEINLLPFHRLGNSKYEQLGLEYRFARTESPTREAMLTHKRMLEENGLRCYLDFETPF